MNKTTYLLACVLAVALMPIAAQADTDADEAVPRGPHPGPMAGPDRDGALHGPLRCEGGPGMRGPKGPRGPMFGPGPDGEPPYLRDLGLSEAQQDRVFAILHAQVPYLREQGKAHRKAEEGLREMHAAGKFDDAAAAKLAQTSAQAIANITLQHLRTEQKILAVLTAEQRKQLQDRQR